MVGRRPGVYRCLSLPVRRTGSAVLGEVKHEASGRRLVSVIRGLHGRVPSVYLEAALVANFPKRARRRRRRIVRFVSALRFSHLKTFACSPRRSAPTTAFRSRVSRRIGRSHRTSVVRLRRRVTFSGTRSVVKERILIVVRNGITSRGTCIKEACHSTPGMSNLVFVGASMRLVSKSFTGIGIAKTLSCSLVKRLV